MLTALGGLLADLTSPRAALAAAGLLILVSPLLLPRSESVVLDTATVIAMQDSDHVDHGNPREVRQ